MMFVEGELLFRKVLCHHKQSVNLLDVFWKLKVNNCSSSAKMWNFMFRWIMLVQ